MADLTEFFRTRANEILDRWRTATRRLPAARPLSGKELLDHMPDVLAAIGDAAAKLFAGERHDIPLLAAHQHALDRLAEGFDVVSVIMELSILRECIVEQWWRASGRDGEAEMRAINVAVDRAVADSVTRYAQARDRALAAIDAISTGRSSSTMRPPLRSSRARSSASRGSGRSMACRCSPAIA